MQDTLKRAVPAALVAGVASILSGSVAMAQCPAPAAPQLYAYQSAATTVDLVVVDSTLAGADHWEVSRTRTGQSPVALLPARIPAATTSIIDQGQGLQTGGTYSYTLTVEDAGGGLTSHPATVVDVGNAPPHTLGSTLTLSPSGFFGFDPATNAPLAWGRFPAPIGRTYAKYLGNARNPHTNAALACASVSVRDPQTGAPVTLYADRYGKFPQANPLTADRHGRFEFRADNGTVDLVVTAGTTSYTLRGVTVFDPRAAQTARAAGGAALTIVTPDGPAYTSDGNVPVKLTRPNSTDPNDGPIPYRLLANQTVNAWALTYNAGIAEATDAVTLDDPVQPAFVLRVSRPARALEFAVDPAYGTVDGGPWVSRTPVLETLLRAGPDRTHFKSLMAPVGAEAIAADADLRAGDVVVAKPDGTVKRATAHAQNPFAVIGVDTPTGVTVVGSRVYLAVAGRSLVRVSGPYALNDPLVANAQGYAVAAPGETDGRYIVGYAARQGGGPGSFDWVQTRTR